jgi:hypothetical protein
MPSLNPVNLLILIREQLNNRYCKIKEYNVCNWLGFPEEFFSSTNRTIPNLSDEEKFEKWQNLEIAKHRLILPTKKIGLDLPSKMSR